MIWQDSIWLVLTSRYRKQTPSHGTATGKNIAFPITPLNGHLSKADDFVVAGLFADRRFDCFMAVQKIRLVTNKLGVSEVM